MTDTYSVVLTTTGSRQEAEKLAAQLVQSKLAACVQVTAITSYYMWKGQPRDDAEFLLLIKTVDRRFEELQAAIRAIHSYEVPEIVQIPVQRGLEEYLDWVSGSTS
jgi:periplasmic divalent cation tolerance protein